MYKEIAFPIFLFISSSFAAEVINWQPALHESEAARTESGDSVNNEASKNALAGASGETRQSNPNVFGGFGNFGNFENSGNFGNFGNFGNIGTSNRGRCPYCDSSVLPYCGDKLFHDACCCSDPYQYPLPRKCHFADCAFLHANSCREHRLISNCCCSDEYRSLLRGLGKPDPATPTVASSATDLRTMDKN